MVQKLLLIPGAVLREDSGAQCKELMGDLSRSHLQKVETMQVGSSCAGIQNHPMILMHFVALKMLNRYDVRQRSACTSWMSSEFGINWSDLCRMW